MSEQLGHYLGTSLAGPRSPEAPTWRRWSRVAKLAGRKFSLLSENGIRSVLLAGGDRHCLYETADRSSSKPVHSDPSLTELKQNTQVVKPGICLTSLPSLGLSTGS